jgi:hypothetical protein
LLPAQAIIQTILDAARIEVELNQANLMSQFEVRRIRGSFTELISAAETEAEVIAAIDGISAEIDNLTEVLNEKLEEPLTIGRENPGLADRIGEAEEYANYIRSNVANAFADSYGEAEIMATAKGTTIVFADRIATY